MSLPSLALALQAYTHKGFTYRPYDGTYPKTGFAVSISGHERRIDAEHLQPDAIDAYWEAVKGTVAAANIVFPGAVCVGAWWDRMGAQWCLDISLVVRSLDEALTIARQNNQLAVWHLDTGEEIAVPYHNPPPAIPLHIDD